MEIILPSKGELIHLLSGVASQKFSAYYSERCAGWNLSPKGLLDTLLSGVMCNYEMGEPDQQTTILNLVVPKLIDALVPGSNPEFRSQAQTIYAAWIEVAKEFVVRAPKEK